MKKLVRFVEEMYVFAPSDNTAQITDCVNVFIERGISKNFLLFRANACIKHAHITEVFIPSYL